MRNYTDTDDVTASDFQVLYCVCVLCQRKMAAAQQQQADAKSDNMAEPPRLSKWPEVMVVVPGISASVIHYVMKELQDAGRLTVNTPNHSQCCIYTPGYHQRLQL